MTKRAVHLYPWDGGTEADSDMPDHVYCGTEGGLTDDQLTNDWRHVTCKRCLKIREKEKARIAAEDQKYKAELYDEVWALAKSLGYFNVTTALADAERYQVLRQADVDTIHNGGLFAGLTPDNIVVNGNDLDQRVDAVLDLRKAVTP